MKVAIIYSGSKTGGGVDTYLANLFEMTPKDVGLELISLGEWKLTNRLEVRGQRFEVFGGAWWNVFNIFRIANYLKKNKFDLIVSQAMVANFYGRAASFVSGIPSLVTIHSDWRTDYRGIKKLIYLLFDQLFRFQTKKYITVSEYLKGRLIAEGIKAKNITVVYNGVTSSKVRGESVEARGGEQGKMVIGSVGRLHPVKNLDQLILAIGKLTEEGKDVKLQLAGEGGERKRLEKIIAENNLEENVELLGWQKNLDKIFSEWDIYAQPSLTEGFGLATVEAMLTGLPVIVTPGGALPELIEEDKTGIVAKGFGAKDLAEAIEGLMTDSNKMKRLAEAGKKHALNSFTVERWAQKTVEAYRKAIQ